VSPEGRTLPGWEGEDAAGWARRLGVPRLALLGSVDSTNVWLRGLAAEGTPPFTTVVAHEQSAGRGREGRGWDSPAGGGLWISVLLPQPPSGPPGVTSLAVGVAVAEALEGVGVGGVRLKWPNDVLVEGGGPVPGKVAGILCEVAPRTGGGGGSAGIVAGIGVNLAPAPSSGGGTPGGWPRGSVTAVTGRWVPAGELAVALLAALRRWGDPPPDRLEGALRQAWVARDFLRGQGVGVTPGPQGRVIGVGDDGALLVDPLRGGDPVAVRGGSVRLLSGDEGAGPAINGSEEG
jgi:BirA family transcriptional regulator, biotin operon repressor / biotin---[acetyl-CoA-carboxylase] ligase